MCQRCAGSKRFGVSIDARAKVLGDQCTQLAAAQRPPTLRGCGIAELCHGAALYCRHGAPAPGSAVDGWVRRRQVKYAVTSTTRSRCPRLL